MRLSRLREGCRSSDSVRDQAASPGDIAACYADASKAKKELGWKAELTIDDMAASSLNWRTKNPNGFRNAE